MERHWFLYKNSTSLEIKKFVSISDSKILKSVLIHDINMIKSLMERIDKIQSNGEMMISFGPKAEQINLSFTCEKGIQEIEIYQKRFKTPSTGFNIENNELETGLYQDINALLFPDFNTITLKVKDLELPFPGFSITYKGEEFIDRAPSTSSFTKNKFLIKDKNKKEQIVEIISGQLSPAPMKIEVNGSAIIILTYQTKKLTRLYPNYFEIIK
jgi:hypothetical protein